MRVLAHVDLDAFYTQVEVKLNPSLQGTPVVVIQYNPYGDLRTLKPSDNRLFPESNGSIIAVSYEARKHGVKRNMTAQQARKLCPALNIVQVPVAHGKSDLTIYRTAGAQVINILSSRAVCERASIDEAYLDVTQPAQQLLAAAAAAAGSGSVKQQQQQQQHEGLVESPALADGSAAAAMLLPLPETVEGWHVAGQLPGAAGVTAWWSRPADTWSADEQLLAAGAVVVAQLRAAVAGQLGYSCSAGVAHSKILAKLGSGLNKPSQQTLVPATAVPGLLGPLPLPKLRQLGGKYGEEVMQGLGVGTVAELLAVPVARLEGLVGVDNAAWLMRLAQGEDDAEVKLRTLPKSISCGKTFRGNTALTSFTAVHNWLKQLATELQERVEADRRDNQRLPTLLTVSIDTTAAAAAGVADAAAAAALATGGYGGSGDGSKGSGKRATAQNWRAGVAALSRSAALRRPVAEVMAEDALKLVKKWARDRGQGWSIIGMFIAASNFVAAPTGASTLHRFVAAAAAAQQQQQKQATSTQRQQQQKQKQQESVHPGSTAETAGNEGTADQPTEFQAPQQQQQGSVISSLMSGCAHTAAVGRSVSTAPAGSTSQAGKRQHVSAQAGHPTGSGRAAKTTQKYGLNMRAFITQSNVSAAAAAAAAGGATEEDERTIASNEDASKLKLVEQQQQQQQLVGLGMHVRQPFQQQQANADQPADVTAGLAAAAAASASKTAGMAVTSPTRVPVSALTVLGISRNAAASDTLQHHCSQQQQQGYTSQQQQQQGTAKCMHPDLSAVTAGAAAGMASGPNMLLSENESEMSVVVAHQRLGTQVQPSQVPVGSLRGWMDASQQQSQQQQQHYSDIVLTPHLQQQQQVSDAVVPTPQVQQHGDLVLAPRLQQQQAPAYTDLTAAAVDGNTASTIRQTTAGATVAPAGAAAAAAAAAPMAVDEPNSSRGGNWQRASLRLSEIDPEVFAELPMDIQLELRRAAAAGKQSSSGRPAGSSKQLGRHGKQGRGGKRRHGVHQGSICKFLTKTG